MSRLNDSAHGVVPDDMVVRATGQRHGGYRCGRADPTTGEVCDAIACHIFAPPGAGLPRDADRLAACPTHKAEIETIWKGRYHVERRAPLDVERPQGVGREKAPQRKARDQAQGSLFE